MSDYFRITSAGTYTGTSGAEMFEIATPEDPSVTIGAGGKVTVDNELKNVKIITGGARYYQSYRQKFGRFYRDGRRF